MRLTIVINSKFKLNSEYINFFSVIFMFKKFYFPFLK